jgi:hypothetical protein
MKNFDLSRLDGKSFERLIRALCFELMGPSGMVYSSGPDGGRDFTIEGKIRGYEAKGWEGYLVLQAKFKEKLQNNSTDVRWLENQLNNELIKFKDKKSGLRLPDYYIIATNISLSGADGKAGKSQTRTGGNTKISVNLNRWKKTLSIKDFDLWPSDKIIDMLAGTTHVRQTYAAWISTGDVLAAAVENMSFKDKDFPNIISRGLKESMRRDRLARLKDAGSVTDSPIRVSQVFVDLPVNDGQSISSPPKVFSIPEEEVKELSQNLTAKIIRRSKEKLDPETVATSRVSSDGSNLPARNKIVVLGGPGQGKSTASMFLAQLFRAAILETDSSIFYDDNFKNLVPEILFRAKKESVDANIPRRYPTFISLPRYADAISSARNQSTSIPSILSYMCSELSADCDTEINKNDLRNWLKNYPWIAIFDGLDEVPQSGERNAIIEALSAFQSDAIELRADILMIVTTRPQGYNHELDSTQWEHWQLVDLPAERAVAYATALGDAKYSADAHRRNELLLAIKEATVKPATSHLMISPLQVTIMYLIVDTGGSVPVARWSLFNEYFEILRKREKSKGGDNQKILERNWAQLGPIHQRAGLILQTDSELAGGAVSYLSKNRFRNILDSLLERDEYEKSDIKRRADELMTVALDRLVLLSSREEEKISFDVRSLQEFMAAAAMTSGREIDVENRLTHIANLSHWRHVFLIAASRCFSDDGLHHLRTNIVAIPRALDSAGLDSYAKSGPMLSLEMLIDGIGSDHPRSRKLLAEHALELLSLGHQVLDERLSHIVDDHTLGLIKKIIREKILDNSTSSYLASWRLLIILSEKYQGEFTSLAEECWPSSPDLVFKILSVLTLPLPSLSMIEKTRASLLAVSPSRGSNSLNDYLTRIKNIRGLEKYPDHGPIAILNYVNNYNHNDEENFINIFSSGVDAPLRFRLPGFINENPILKIGAPDAHADWIPIIASVNFALDRSVGQLLNTLTLIRDNDCLRAAKEVLWHLPWQISLLISPLEDNEELSRRIDDIRNGKCGDSDTWKAAEDRWFKNGIQPLDFDVDLELVKNINTIGTPGIYSYQITHENTKTELVFNEFIKIITNIKQSKKQELLVKICQFTALGLDSSQFTLSKTNAKLIISAALKNKTQISLNMLALVEEEFWNDQECLEIINKNIDKFVFYAANKANYPTEKIVNAFNASPKNRGLIGLLVLSLHRQKDEYLYTIKNLDESAFLTVADDNSCVAFSVTILKFLRGDNLDSQAIALHWCNEENIYPFDLSLVISYFKNETFSNPQKAKILESILYILDSSKAEKKYEFREPLVKILNSRKSLLRNNKVWKTELNLPEEVFEILSS